MNRKIAVIFTLLAAFLSTRTGVAIADGSMSDLLNEISHPSIGTVTDSGLEGDGFNKKSRSSQQDDNLMDSGHIFTPLRSGSTRGKDVIPYVSILTLEELQKDFKAAPDVLVAAAEFEESLRMLERKRARSGLKIFSGAGIGAYREPVTDTIVRDYQRANVRVGLRYPLLGSLAEERSDIFKAEVTTRQKEQEVALINQQSLVTLRTFFINYWSSHRKMALSQAFLENETDVERVLAHRTGAGYLLDADRQEFLSAFALAHRNIANLKISQNRALNVLRLITRPELKVFIPATPKLPSPCLDRAKLKTLVVASHPEIILLKKKIEDLQVFQQVDRNSELKADVSLAGTATRDLPDDEPGYGVSIHFNVEFPAKIKKANTAGREYGRAALAKVQRQLELKSATLWQTAEEALDRFQAALVNVDFATLRLKAGMESVRENLLRSAYLEGDTIEQLQKSRYAYYQNAMDYVDAETNRLLTHVALLQFGLEGCQPRKAENSEPALGIRTHKNNQPFFGRADTEKGGVHEKLAARANDNANPIKHRSLVLNDLVIVPRSVTTSQ